MGWCKSPPLFCVGSETARDIMINLSNQQLPTHKYEADILNNISIDCTTTNPTNSTTLFESYVDNFIT